MAEKEQELEDARKEIADGKSELADAQKKLNDSRQEIVDLSRPGMTELSTRSLTCASSAPSFPIAATMIGSSGCAEKIE